MKSLFLDDIRKPKDGSDIVRSFDEFKNYIETHEMPDVISFDHDLGEEKTGYDCMKYLVSHLMNNPHKTHPFVNIHSANPVGAENIFQYWKGFKKFLIEEELTK